MARVRVDPEAVSSAVDAFRPGGSATPLSADRDYEGHLHLNPATALQLADHAMRSPALGVAGNLLARGVSAIGRGLSGATGSTASPIPTIPGGMGQDVNALRAAAAERIRQRMSGATAARPDTSLPQMGGHAGLAQAQGLQDAENSRIDRGIPAYQAPRPPAPLASAQDVPPPMHPDVQAVHDRVFDPNRPHIPDEDIGRYRDLRKQLQVATAAGKPRAELDRILHELDVQREKITNGPAGQPSPPPAGARPEMGYAVTPPTAEHPNGVTDPAASAAYRQQVTMVKTPKGEMPAVKVDANRVVLHDPSSGEFVIVTRNPDGTKRTQLLSGEQAQALLSDEQRQQFAPQGQDAAPAASPGAAAPTAAAPAPAMDPAIAARKQEVEARISALYNRRTALTPAEHAEADALRQEYDAINQDSAAPQPTPQPAASPAPADAPATPAATAPADATAPPAPAATAPVPASAPTTAAPTATAETPATDLNGRLMQLAAKARAGTMTDEDHRESELLMQHYNAQHPASRAPVDTSPKSREQLLAMAASARTPEQQAEVLRQSADADVWGTTLADLLTGSHEARSQFAHELHQMMPQREAHKTPEELAHIAAQTGLANAQRDFYRTDKPEQLRSQARAKDIAESEKMRHSLVDEARKSDELYLKRQKSEADDRHKTVLEKLGADKLDEAQYKFDKMVEQGFYDPSKRKPMSVNVSVREGLGVKEAQALGDYAHAYIRDTDQAVLDMRKKLGALPAKLPEPEKPEVPPHPEAPEFTRNELIVDKDGVKKKRDDYAAELKAWRTAVAEDHKAWQKEVKDVRDRNATRQSTETELAKLEAETAPDAPSAYNRAKKGLDEAKGAIRNAPAFKKLLPKEEKK